MINFSSIALIGLLVVFTPVISGQVSSLPDGISEETIRLINQMERSANTYDIIKARDKLAQLGTGIEGKVWGHVRLANQQTKWGLLQTLGLTGGEKARVKLQQVLESTRFKTKPGCLCLAALGMRDNRGEDALVALVRSPGASAPWSRVIGFLGLSVLPLATVDVESFRVQVGRFCPQEKAALLLLLGRKCGPAQARIYLEKFWPETVRDWNDRLIRRACAIVLARHKIAAWKPQLLTWLQDQGKKKEDKCALALALGALGLNPSDPVLSVIRPIPLAFAGYLSQASVSPASLQIRDLADARAKVKGGKDPFLGVFAGAYARAISDADLPGKTAGYVGPEAVRDVLLLELAIRVARSWRTSKAQEYLKETASRSWNRKSEAGQLLVAALAVRGVVEITGEVPKGNRLDAKAFRGEVSAEVVAKAVGRALLARQANLDYAMNLAEEELARVILLGPTSYLARKDPALSPPGGEAGFPGGAPRRGVFYEQLDAFLRELPLYR